MEKSSHSGLADILSPILGPRASRLADVLITEFGSIAGICAASPQALRRVLGTEVQLAEAIQVGRQMLETAMRERIERAPVDSADPKLLEWLVMRLGGQREEHLLALFLDSRRGFIAEACFGSGHSNCVEITPRALLGRAMKLDCWAILLAHNHPSGDPTPSKKDVIGTRKILKQGRELGVDLIDHLVIAGPSVLSMKRGGFL